MIFGNIKAIWRNETLRNGAFFTLFSFINKGVNFLLLLLLAKFITPTEYGYWSLFGTVVMFMGYFIALTTEGYIAISYFQEGMSGVRKSFSCIFSTTLIVAACIVLLIWLLQPVLGNHLGIPWKCLYLALGISFFTVYSNVCLDFFRIKKNILHYGVFACVSAVLVLGVSVFLVKSMHMGWQGCVLAQLVCTSLAGLIGFACYFRMGCLGLPDRRHWRMMLSWGIPLIPHLATAFIRFGCDRYIVNHFYSIEEVGYFSFAVTLATAIVMIGSGFNDANSVHIFEVLGNKELPPDRKLLLLGKQKKAVFFVYLSCSTAIAILCCILVPVFLPQYAPAVGCFAILAVYAFLQCIYFLYTNFLYYFKRTKKLMAITFSWAVVHFALSLLLTRYSIHFTCLVYVASQAGIVLVVRRNAIKAIEANLTGDDGRS